MTIIPTRLVHSELQLTRVPILILQAVLVVQANLEKATKEFERAVKDIAQLPLPTDGER
jgi:hypothetical protein